MGWRPGLLLLRTRPHPHQRIFMNLQVTPKGTFSFARLGPLALQAKASKVVEDDEWSAYMSMCARDLEQHGLAERVIHYVQGPSPSVEQLLALGRVMGPGGVPHRSATVADSLVVGGSLVSLRWHLRANVEIRTFAPGLEHQALQWLAEEGRFDVKAAAPLFLACMTAVGIQRGSP